MALFDPKEPSEFVLELLNPEYELKIISEHFTPEALAASKCPKCSHGYFKPIKGKRGNYECSTGLGCLVEAVDCDKCNCIAVKNDGSGKCLSCGTNFQLCPSCKDPKMVRTGKYGLFIGCSAYKGDKDKSCQYKSKLSPILKKRLKDMDRIPC